MATVVTTATSYASSTDLGRLYDVNKICQYATDSGVPPTPADLSTNAIVTAVLLRASGEVEMACLRGEKYTPTTLSALTVAAQAALKGLVCDLAFYHLAKRRVPNPKEVTAYEDAMEILKALNDGTFKIQWIEMKLEASL